MLLFFGIIALADRVHSTIISKQNTVLLDFPRFCFVLKKNNSSLLPLLFKLLLVFFLFLPLLVLVFLLRFLFLYYSPNRRFLGECAHTLPRSARFSYRCLENQLPPLSVLRPSFFFC